MFPCSDVNIGIGTVVGGEAEVIVKPDFQGSGSKGLIEISFFLPESKMPLAYGSGIVACLVEKPTEGQFASIDY